MTEQTGFSDRRVIEGDRYFYEGEFYARPVERGIYLGDEDYLDGAVYSLLGDRYSRSGGSAGRIRISIEILDAVRR